MKPVALVLAAGASHRAGMANKLLARDAAGRCMVTRSVEAALRSRAASVLVVLGHQAAEVAEAMRDDGLHPDAEGQQGRLRLIRAPDHAAGLSASLRCGIALAREGGAPAALVCLGDMPLVRTATLDRLIAALGDDVRALAWVPTLRGRRGNPVLWRSTLFDPLLTLSGDRGGRPLLARHDAGVREVPVDDPGVLEDFDTPDRLRHFATLAHEAVPPPAPVDPLAGVDQKINRTQERATP